MFDIGLEELLLVSIIGLLVLGPERLPGAIRTISLWVGRLRRSFNSIRAEIEREINAEEIRQQLHNEEVMQSLKEAENSIRDGLNPAREPEAPDTPKTPEAPGAPDTNGATATKKEP